VSAKNRLASLGVSGEVISSFLSSSSSYSYYTSSDDDGDPHPTTTATTTTTNTTTTNAAATPSTGRPASTSTTRPPLPASATASSAQKTSKTAYKNGPKGPPLGASPMGVSAFSSSFAGLSPAGRGTAGGLSSSPMGDGSMVSEASSSSSSDGSVMGLMRERLAAVGRGRDEEIGALLLRIAELEDTVGEAAHQRTLLELRYKADVQRYVRQCSELQAATEAQLAVLKARQDEVDELVPSLRARLEADRGAVLAEPTQEELQRILSTPEVELGVADAAKAARHRAVDGLTKQLAAAQARLAAREASHHAQAEELAAREREARRLAAELAEAEKAYKARVRALEDRCLELDKRANDAQARAEANQAKADASDSLAKRRDALSERCQQLERDLAAATAELNSSRSEREDARSALASATQKAELVRMDKAHLEKHLDAAVTRSHDLEDALARKKAKNRSLKDAHAKVVEDMLSLKRVMTVEREETVKAELARIEAHAEERMAEIKAQSRELSDRELASARERCDALTLEADRCRRRAEDAKQRYEDLHRAHQEFRVAAEGQQAALRNDVQLKQHQLDTTAAALEDARERGVRAEAEAEAAHARLHLIQGEYLALQAATTARIRELTAAGDEAERRLEAYEAMERELDGALEDGGGGGGGGGRHSGAAALAGLAASVPTSDRRRAEHVQRLATRLRQALSELAAARAEAAELRDGALPALKREADEARSALALTQQPYAFLVETLAAKERELEDTRQVCSRLRSKAIILRDKLREVSDRYHALAEDHKAGRKALARVTAKPSKRAHPAMTVAEPTQVRNENDAPEPISIVGGGGRK
jgi:chromosome segregation ATPase